MRLLAIKDNKPGHYNQTEGLILAIKEIYPHLYVEYLDIQITNSLCRKILKILINTIPLFFTYPISLQLANIFYKTSIKVQKKPDIIISTGGNTASINAWLAKIYQCKNILNGKTRGLNEKNFTVITTVIDLGYSNQIILDVAPSTITQTLLLNEILSFRKKYNLQDSEYYTLLVGGDGAGYTYTDMFYNRLIAFIKNMTAKTNIKWLISTSRRTPLKIEHKLKIELTDESAYFLDFHQNPENILHSFLAIANKIFVTEESSSMISEAIAAKKEVYTVGINTNKSDINYQTILKKFENEHKIKRINLNQDTNLPLFNFHISKKEYYQKHSLLLKPYLE